MYNNCTLHAALFIAVVAGYNAVLLYLVLVTNNVVVDIVGCGFMIIYTIRMIALYPHYSVMINGE